MQPLFEPNKEVKFYHYICQCGKPVGNDKSWFSFGKQYHFGCLPK